MHHLKQDGIYFLQGLTVTLAMLAAIATLGGVLLTVMIAIAPGELEDSLRHVGGRTLEGDLMLAAFIQTVVWYWLPRIHFVAWQFGHRMAIALGIVTLFMFTMVVFSFL